MSIYPSDIIVADPYWRDTEKNILMAAFVYYFDIGLSFIEIITKVANSSIEELCEDINSSNNSRAKKYIRDLPNVDSKNIASFGNGLRNVLANLSENPYFGRAFSGSNNNSNSFGRYNQAQCANGKHYEPNKVKR